MHEGHGSRFAVEREKPTPKGGLVTRLRYPSAAFSGAGPSRVSHTCRTLCRILLAWASRRTVCNLFDLA